MKQIIEGFKKSPVEIEIEFELFRECYGHYRIVCSASLNNNKKKISYITGDSEWYDSFMEKKADGMSLTEWNEILKEKCWYAIEEMIIEWVVDVVENNN